MTSKTPVETSPTAIAPEAIADEALDAATGGALLKTSTTSVLKACDGSVRTATDPLAKTTDQFMGYGEGSGV